jgi:2,5-furandicarboxylate decarboxylase 1
MVVNYRDLRGFIDILERESELVRTIKAVNRDYQATALLAKMELERRFEAVLFEQVEGFPGWRLMGNTFSTKKKLALALNTTEEKVGEEFRLRAAKPIPPRLVTSGPVKENIITGPDVLDHVPFVTHHEKDAGRYISLGICVAKDPETGVRNIGIYRHMIKGGDYLVPSYSSASNITNLFLKAESMGKPLQVALIPGVDPLIALAASHAVPLGIDEYGAGGIGQVRNGGSGGSGKCRVGNRSGGAAGQKRTGGPLRRFEWMLQPG